MTQPAAQVATALAEIAGPRVACACLPIAAAHPPLFDAERRALARAVPRRIAEFAAGRAAARQAMQALGAPPAAIPMGADRAPVWPDGLTGSLSHGDSLAVAVLSRQADHRGLGVDIETDAPLPADLVPAICRASERARIAGPGAELRARMIFSAKEAVFKAQYPSSGVLLGFHDLDVRLVPGGGRFAATFCRDAGPFAMGDTLPGGLLRLAGHLVTFAAIAQSRA